MRKVSQTQPKWSLHISIPLSNRNYESLVAQAIFTVAVPCMRTQSSTLVKTRMYVIRFISIFPLLQSLFVFVLIQCSQSSSPLSTPTSMEHIFHKQIWGLPHRESAAIHTSPRCQLPCLTCALPQSNTNLEPLCLLRTLIESLRVRPTIPPQTHSPNPLRKIGFTLLWKDLYLSRTMCSPPCSHLFAPIVTHIWISPPSLRHEWTTQTYYKLKYWKSRDICGFWWLFSFVRFKRILWPFNDGFFERIPCFSLFRSLDSIGFHKCQWGRTVLYALLECSFGCSGPRTIIVIPFFSFLCKTGWAVSV